MNALYMVVGTLITLGVLVTFHEFGHFWVARRCGVKVIRFSVGFGTPLIRWRDRKGTEFVIAAIPLGGYVHMLGDQEDDVPEQMLSQTFNHKTILQRVAIVAAGPIANFILALVFFWFLAMLGSQQIKPIVGAVDDGSLAAKAGLRSDEEIVAVDGRPTLGWNAVNLQLVRRLGESGTLAIATKPANSQSEITHMIYLQNWLKGTEEPDPIGALGLHPWRPTLVPVLAELEPGPAKDAGLKAGDRILTIDDQPVSDWQNVVDWVRARPDAKTVLLIDRQGVQQSITVTLAAKGEGKNRFGYMGAGVKSPEIPADKVREVRYGPVDALAEGATRTWAMSVLTLETVKKMLIGELSVKNLSGAITIAKVAGASAQSGFKDFLNFLAYLSISLGVFNLLPIPVLDGGRLLFYLIEWARGRPLSERVQGWGMQIGVSLVVGVMLLALINDVSRL